MLPFAGGLMGVVGKNLKKDSMEVGQEQGSLTSQLEEMLGGLRIIKAFNAEGKIGNRFHNQTKKIRDAIIKVVKRQYLAHPMSEFLGTMIISIVVCYGGYLILCTNSGLQASVFIYYILIFYSIINPIKELSRASYNVRKGMGSLERIDKIMAAENPLTWPEDAVSLKEFTDKIEYKNISFKYKNDWVLQDVNLTINRGKTIALVGQSGSGKSTLVDLLPRFWDVNEGKILIDGVNIQDIKRDELRHNIAIVLQDTVLFSDTIENNIKFFIFCQIMCKRRNSYLSLRR